MATVAHRKAIGRELEIINDPLTGEERPRVAELVRQLHAASSVDEFFNLHTKLLARYLVRQRFRDDLEADRRAVETRIAPRRPGWRAKGDSNRGQREVSWRERSRTVMRGVGVVSLEVEHRHRLLHGALSSGARSSRDQIRAM
jgi:hypothetical protein